MNELKTLTPKEVSGMLRCGVDFVRAEIKRGNLAPVIRVNSRVILIRYTTVLAYIEAKSKLAA